MAILRADENRYLLQSGPSERVAIIRIPGVRPGVEGRGWQLPRQAAVILALDRVLGRESWSADPMLAQEVAESRGRKYAPAQAKAHVRLERGLLSVECTIADKELVKQVPGYRWSPAQTRWYVAAMPLALDILRDVFVGQIMVDRDAQELVELRRLDETREAEVAERRAPIVPKEFPVAGLAPVEPFPPYEELRRIRPEGASPALEPLLERLALAVESLVLRLDSLVTAAPSPPVTTTTTEPAYVEPTIGGWRDLLARSATDAEDAWEDARRQLQTAHDPDNELRAVAGIAAWRAGDPREAFKSLRKALEGNGTLEDNDLSALARRTYEEVVLALITSDCGPAAPVTSIETLRELLRCELSDDTGFDDERVVTELVQLLVNDRALRWVSPVLSDYCRILHLLAVARRGTSMSAELVVEVLKEQSLHADAFALGCILYASVCHGEKSAADWSGRWPGTLEGAPTEDASWLVEVALRKLGTADRMVAGEAALAVLACIAAGPPEQATLSHRRMLVGFVDQGRRQYAEFLALYRLAANGERLPLDTFPGYVEFLADVPLQQSAGYLGEVYLTGEGVAGSAVRALADVVYMAALRTHGLTDPQEQMLALVDLLRAGSKPDQLMNKLAALVEEDEFPGSLMLDRDARIFVYRAAYDQGTRMGHDKDSLEAFFRLVRALEVEPGAQPLIDLCNVALTSIKRLRLPAALTLLETLLGEGLPFEEHLEVVEGMFREGAADPLLNAQLDGLQVAYPALREKIGKRLAEWGVPQPEILEQVSSAGVRVLVVGGHQRLRARAAPLLEHVGMRVVWLDSTESKTGTQVVDLVRGACDVVVVNTAYIGHAQSNRVMDEARKLDKPILAQPYNGLGSMLSVVSAWIRERDTPEPSKQSKSKQLGKRLRR